MPELRGAVIVLCGIGGNRRVAGRRCRDADRFTARSTQ